MYTYVYIYVHKYRLHLLSAASLPPCTSYSSRSVRRAAAATLRSEAGTNWCLKCVRKFVQRWDRSIPHIARSNSGYIWLYNTY